MVLKKRGARTSPKRDWRSEPEDPPVERVDSIPSPPPRARKPISGVRQKGVGPNAATIDVVTADLRKDPRRED